MALAVPYSVTVTGAATTSTVLYTTASSGLPARDLVVTNGGVSTCYITAGTGATASTNTQGFIIPSGGSLLLTECNLVASTILYGYAAAAPAGGLIVSIGYGSVVSVI